MTVTRLRPFGARRKTYFYGVAGFVLAAHVVVGAILRVMPPDFEEIGTIIPVEVQIVDHLLPDDVVESSAVRMVEEAPPEEEELPVFLPVWEPSPAASEGEPIGPTESVLPDVVVEEAPESPPAAPVPVRDEAVDVPSPAPASASPPERRSEPAPRSSTPPVKTAKVEPRKVESSPPVEPEPEVVEPEIERAIPVKPSSPGRTGILNRLRNKQESGAGDEPYEVATWAKRPPPFYPYEARKRGIEGTAHVRVSIDSRGRITAARLSKSSGDELLDKAAMASVRKGVLNPAQRGGGAVASEMLVPFEFYLP